MNYNYLFIAVVLMFLSSCEKNSSCDGSQEPVAQIGENLESDNNYDLEESMDTEVHEFNFVFKEDVTLCGIGYRSHNRVDDYLITISDLSGNILFEDRLAFSSNRLEIIGVENISFTAGEEYVISRNCDVYDGITRTVGQVFRPRANSAEFAFPIESDIMSITQSAFYGNGNASGNLIPLIELAVF